MVFSTFVGSLAQPGATGNQSYTGVGFQPKALLFFGNVKTADGTAVDLNVMFGMATSSTSRAVIANNAVDGTGGNHNADGRSDNTKCCAIIDSGGTVVAAADLVSLDADGFTLNWTTADATARVVNYVALGGADLTNVFIKELTSPTSTGSVGYTGVGFQPDCIIAMSAGSVAAVPGAYASARIGVGWATNATDEYTSGFIVVDASSGTAISHHSNDRTIAVPLSTVAYLISGSTVSLDADGFTINWTTVQATARFCWVLCLKGGAYKAGSILSPTGTGTQATTGVGFRPSGILLGGSVQAADVPALGAGAQWSIGAGSSATARGAVFTGHTQASNAPADQDLDRTAVYKMWTPGTPTLLADADLQSLDADGFTLNWTTAATARGIPYLAFPAGPAVGGAGSGSLALLGVG